MYMVINEQTRWRNRHLRRKDEKTGHIQPKFRVSANAQLPWRQRLEAIIAEIDKRGGKMYVNRKWCRKTNTNDPEAKDLRRAIKLGFLKMARDGYPGRCNYSFLTVAKRP